MRRTFSRNYDFDFTRAFNEAGLTPAKVLKSTMRQPIYCFEITNDPANPWVFLSGSVHGNEPGGSDFLRSCLLKGFFTGPAAKHLNYVIIPCVNPDGYQYDTRYNADNIDLNRDFSDNPKSEEVKQIQQYIKSLGIKFEFSIDFHETGGPMLEDSEEHDDPPHDFYMWEICEKPEKTVAKKVIKCLKNSGYNTCNWPKIFGDTNNNGAIFYPEDCASEEYKDAKSFDAYMQKFYTDVAVTTETCVHDSFSYRNEVMYIVLRTYMEANFKC